MRSYSPQASAGNNLCWQPFLNLSFPLVGLSILLGSPHNFASKVKHPSTKSLFLTSSPSSSECKSLLFHHFFARIPLHLILVNLHLSLF